MGGQPSPDCIDITNLPGSPTDIQILFGIGRDIESCDLLSVAKTHKELVSQGVLPIASDSGGNLFGLVLYGDGLGKIVYLDFGNMTKTQYYVASNFSEFVGKFRKFIYTHLSTHPRDPTN